MAENQELQDQILDLEAFLASQPPAGSDLQAFLASQPPAGTDPLSFDVLMGDLQSAFQTPATQAPATQQDSITQLENELRAIRRSELLGGSLPEIKKPDFKEDYQDYKTRLEGILSRPREIGFYDLISDLGAAMLTTDPTVGPFQAAGRGFANFNERLRARREASRQIDQQAALTAFQMAQSNQERAMAFLNQRNIELIKAANKNPKMVNYTVPKTDDTGKVIGTKNLPINENNKLEIEAARRAGGERNPVPQTQVTLPSGSSKFADLRAASLSQAIDDIQEQALAASQTLQRLKAVQAAAEAINYDVGIIQAGTKPIRQFLAEAGVIDYGNLEEQELIQTLNTQLALGLTAQTKGPISDREMSDFKSAMPGLGRTPEGLRKQIEYMFGVARYQQKFFDDFVNDAELQETLGDPNISAPIKSNAINRWTINWQKTNRLTTESGEQFSIDGLTSAHGGQATPLDKKALREAHSAQSGSINSGY